MEDYRNNAPDSVEQQNEEQIVEQIYNCAVDLLVNQKLSPEDAKLRLQEMGLDEEAAGIVVTNTVAAVNDQKKKGANRNMIFGSLWVVGGLIVTVATYSMAQPGGRYVIAWGAVIFGGIQFVKGLIDRLSC